MASTPDEQDTKIEQNRVDIVKLNADLETTVVEMTVGFTDATSIIEL